jgi:hypothetical protein
MKTQKETEIIVKIKSADGEVLFEPSFSADRISEKEDISVSEIKDLIKQGSLSFNNLFELLDSSQRWSDFQSYAASRKTKMPKKSKTSVQIKTTITEEINF